MLTRAITRRHALTLTGVTVAAGFLLTRSILEGQPAAIASEVVLVDDPTRGYYGDYDVTNFGPAVQRKAKRDFEFPNDVDAALGYGIDISHHTTDVPWASLKSAQINYVYMKASQSLNGRDGAFVDFWKEARKAGLPCGAYHFLTAGVTGSSQAGYFVRRLAEVGGLSVGDLQPVVDLEWDTFGANFKRVKADPSSSGQITYKDYWDDIKPLEIVTTVNECVSALRSGISSSAIPSSKIKPIIYTNRSWWETHMPNGTVFPDCSVWISDYRQASYANSSPRSVQGHLYYLWQFTDQAHIRANDALHGPYDCNKLLFGGVEHLRIG